MLPCYAINESLFYIILKIVVNFYIYILSFHFLWPPIGAFLISDSCSNFSCFESLCLISIQICPISKLFCSLSSWETLQWRDSFSAWKAEIKVSLDSYHLFLLLFSPPKSWNILDNSLIHKNMDFTLELVQGPPYSSKDEGA